jgi:gluconolactonase
MKPALILYLLWSSCMNAADFSFIKVMGDLNFPEGPAWDGRANLYVSNCRGYWISCIGPGQDPVFLRASMEPFTFGKTNGMTVYQDGSLYACDFGIGAIIAISMDKKSYIVAKGFSGKRFNAPNDLAFAPDGTLYFTDPNSHGADKPDGVVYRVDLKSGQVHKIIDQLCFPNGLAFSADGKFLFVCESAKERVLRYDVNKDGSCSNMRVFCSMPGGDPDGMAFDVENHLYVAHFGGGTIQVFNYDGSLVKKIPAPGKKPSNVEFAGKDMRTLFITEDESNAVYKMPVAVPGLPLFCSPARL